MRRGSVKSFVDDLVLGRDIVISRAATTLRSVEIQSSTRRFVRFRRTYLRIGRGLGLFGAPCHFTSRKAGSTPAPGNSICPLESVSLLAGATNTARDAPLDVNGERASVSSSSAG